MANNLYISEYTQNTIDLPVLAAEPSTATQKVDFTAGATQSSAFRNDTKLVRIHAEAICSVRFGTNPTATTADMRMVAGQTEYFKTSPAFKLSVIANT